MLTSVDLFTGIGGFVLGLEGIFQPIVYCDCHPTVHAALDACMRKERLPRAPIVDDVKKYSDIASIVNGRHVDIVTLGSPCVGFSDMGARQGLLDERSALFYGAMRVVRALRPTFVFLENVEKITTANGGKDFETILIRLRAAGYDCRWTTCSANDVGLPQARSRWFCLGVRRHAALPAIQSDPERSLKGGRMPKIVCLRAADYAERYFLLGNSVVPAVVRLAFFRLLAGFDHLRLSSSRTAHGFTRRGQMHWVALGPGGPGEIRAYRSVHTITLNSEHYKPQYVPRNLKQRAPPIVGDRVIHNWPTPRATAPRHSNSLTTRNLKDLPTAALFARSVQGVAQPVPVQGMTVNPRFVEWLMGFPKDHTLFRV